MSEVSKTLLIKSDGENNHNKFWEATLYDDDRVECRWGRVGSERGQSKTFYGGQAYIDKKVKEKRRKGYREARVMAGGGEGKVKVGGLSELARNQIRHGGRKEITSLISNLVKWNTHNITAHSNLTVDIDSGSIQLPSGMGVLTQDAINEARDLLDEIGQLGKKKRGKRAREIINEYLMLVPQVVPRNRGWIDYIFKTNEEIEKQEELLDSLEGTLQTISSAPKSSKQDEPKLFDVELDLVDDGRTLKKIEKKFKDTRRQMHDSYSYRVNRVYSVRLGEMSERFERCKIGNVKELWHGTKLGNLLSILKSGLIIPRHAAHGRAFGNGVYFSDQSTKALNYASGWWGGSAHYSNCFMFLADVRMGNPYIPQGRAWWGDTLPKPGYDSTFAKADVSGVMNNEMIVYSLDQINLKYLVEFTR